MHKSKSVDIITYKFGNRRFALSIVERVGREAKKWEKGQSHLFERYGKMRKKILLVCAGNTCRSVMAQGIMQKILQEMGVNSELMQVCSAGVVAYPGEKASKEALLVMEEIGIDMSRHYARPLTESLAREADLIIAMTRGQKQIITSVFLAAENKVVVLKEFAGEEGDIEDPAGRSQEFYYWTAQEMQRLLVEVVKKIFTES